MKKTSLTLQIIHILISLIIIYSITAIVPRLISNYLTTYFYLGVLVLCLLLVMVSRGTKSISEYIVLVIPFLFWKILIYFVSKPALIDWGYGIVLNFTPVILGLFVLKRLDHSSAKLFTVIIVLSVLVTMITTYVGLTEYPDAARYLATVADANEAKNVKYEMMNIGGYGFVYTVVLLYPVVIYAFKRGLLNRIAMIVIATVSVLFIVQTGYTTALLLWFFSTTFIFFNKNFRPRYLIVVVIFTALVFFALFDLLSHGLKLLAEIINNRDISERLLALSGGMTGLEKLDDDRMEVWMISVNEFLAHPILGNLSFAGGGHSFILDTLAQFGLLGAALLAVIYTVIYRNFFLPFRKQSGYGFIVWMFIQTVFLSIVNSGMWLTVLCFYIPLLLKAINEGERKNEGSLDRELCAERFRTGAVR